MKKIVILIGLISLVGLNFYIYRGEFSVLVDPNDNIFQYALVDEARDVWKNIFEGKLSPLYLFDSWNERWAEGFSLSNYYAHLPQAVIGLFGGYKLFVTVRTLMVILLPLMFFWSGAILHLPLAFSLILALFSQSIFTDGLYGIDATSFVWRGWGLSAQLMSVFFLPPAFAYTIDYFVNKRNLGKAVLLNFLVAQCHFGIFSLLLLGYGLFAPYMVVSSISIDQLLNGNLRSIIFSLKKALEKSLSYFYRTIVFVTIAFISLAYFIVPFFLQSQYRNFSVWDPIWKFDSWGARQTIVWFLSGDLFDFNRYPFITYLVLFGIFYGLVEKKKIFNYLSLLFVFFIVLFFGRTTLGGLIDIVPGFSEYHLHRIVAMVQFTGLYLGAWFLYTSIKKLDTVFLAPVGVLARLKLAARLPKSLKKGILAFFCISVLILIYYLEKPLLKYTEENNIWIERSSRAYLDDLPSYEKIKAKLASLPKARVYVGKPGNWGRQFTVGEVPMYMNLSRDGYPVIGFLPESWSPNSDSEQFFDEYSLDSYRLYNVRYVILPESQKPPEFGKLLAEEGKYSLYTIPIGNQGWFDFGKSAVFIRSSKTSLLTVTRLWMESDLAKGKNIPIVDLSSKVSTNPNQQWAGKLWQIQMSDGNNYFNLNDKIERSIWQGNPFSALKSQPIVAKLENYKEAITPNGYKVTFNLNRDCEECVLLLKQSYHPNWKISVNGREVDKFIVLPFFVGTTIDKAGNYQISAKYQQNNIKVALLLVSMIVFVCLLFKDRLPQEKHR